MDNAKIVKFIKQLSKDTLAGKLYWKRLTDYEKIASESNKPIFNMLFQSEFRRVDFSTSYYCSISNGTIFILDEINDSGRDGVLTADYRLYLYDEFQNKVFQLQCTAGTVYQLINSIHSYLANEEAGAESFIDNYLSQN